MGGGWRKLSSTDAAEPATSSVAASAANALAAPVAKPSAKRELRELVRDAIVDAFFAAHDGYSIDWLLANPQLQDVFHEECREAGLIGGPVDWNRELLRFRKTGGFPKRGKIKKVHVADEELDAYDFAAEIAWRLANDKFHGPSLDEILLRSREGGVLRPDGEAIRAGLRAGSISLGRAAAAQGEPRSGRRSEAVSLRVRQARLQPVPNLAPLQSDAAQRSAGHLPAARRGQSSRCSSGDTRDLGRRLAQHRRVPRRLAMRWRTFR